MNIGKGKFGFENFVVYLISLYMSTFFFVAGLTGVLLRGTFAFTSVMFLGGLGLLAVVIYATIMLYRLWKYAIGESIKAGLKPTIESPGAAVGRLFIPFYNFYWIFVCLRGLPNDLTAIAVSRGLSARLSPGVATATGVLCLISCLPFVGFFISLITSLILYPIYFYQVIAFTRNLEIYDETGKDLFVVGYRTWKELAAVRNYGDFFSGEGKEDWGIGVAYFLGLLLIGVSSFFWAWRPFVPSMSMIVKDLILAVLLVVLSQRLREAWMMIGGWALAVTVVSLIERFIFSYYYGPFSWGTAFAGHFIYGLVFMGLLQLSIRLWGVTWWTIFGVVIIASFFSLRGTLPYLQGNLAAIISILINLLLSSGVMVVAVYLGFYLNLKLHHEKKILSE